MVTHPEDQAKSVAREVFFLRHPEHLPWFDQTWDQLIAKRCERQTCADPVAWVLGAVSGHRLAHRRMATDLALLFATFAQSYPVFREELFRKMEEIGRSQGRSDLQMESWRRDVAEVTDSQEVFYCWQSKGSEYAQEATLNTAEERQRLLNHAKRFDLFVCRGTVLNGDSQTTRTTGVTGRVYRLLVLLLRYKLEHLPVGQLYFPAWGRKGTESEQDIMEYLKPAVSELRTRLKMVSGFRVEKHQDGYVCSGQFASCVILSDSEQRTLRISF